MFGPRFRGTHKVFAPQPDSSNPAGRGGSEHRQDIPTNIVGIHGIYDYQVRKPNRIVGGWRQLTRR